MKSNRIGSVTAFLFTCNALAIDIHWQNPSSGGFSNAANWGGLVPGFQDNAIFGGNGGGNLFLVSFNSSPTINDLRVHNQFPFFQLGTQHLTVGGTINVGGSSTASLSISGGSLNAALLRISGDQPTGTVRIINSAVSVNEFGVGFGNPPTNGTLIVTGPSATFNKTQCCDYSIGHGANNSGSFTIENAASANLINGYFAIGREGGTGTLNILSNGMLFNSAGQAGIENGSATVSGSGSLWSLSGNLGVGAWWGGNASLQISDSALVQSQSFSVDSPTGSSQVSITAGGRMEQIAGASVKRGSASITGENSSWTVAQHLSVGSFTGDASVMVSGAAQLTCGHATIGGESGLGNISVTGMGSRWRSNATVSVGNRLGDGTIDLSAGARMEVASGFLAIGGHNGGTGLLKVRDPGTLLQGGLGDIGSNLGGSGVVQVSNGGRISGANPDTGSWGLAWIGNGVNATGLVTVSGVGSRWEENAQIQVGGSPWGDNGVGELIVEDGAYVACTQAVVAQQSQNIGHISINGAGSIWDVTNNLALAPGGTGSIDIGAGATLKVGHLTSGIRGTVRGTGTVLGHMTNGGILRPGSPFGDLQITGNFVQASTGVLMVSIGSAGNSKLAVTGPASLGGTLNVQLQGTLSAESGETVILTSPQTLSGTFQTLLLPYLGADQLLTVNYGSSSLDTGSGGTDGGGSVGIQIGTPNGNPELGDSQSFALEGEPTGVVEAAIDTGNPARDLALAVAALDPLQNGNVLLLINDSGNGTSFDPIIIEVGKQPSGIVASALSDSANADDIAVTNKGDNTVTVLFHDGGNIYSAPLTIPVGTAPSAIAAGDLNNDGLIDLAVSNEGSNNVTLLFNNGDRTFAVQSPIAVGAEPRDIIMAPLGGAGGSKALDLAVANSGGNSVTILFNSGTGAIANTTTQPVGVKPIRIRAEDVDNPRDLSLLVSNEDSSNVSLLRNLSNQTFAPAVHLPMDGAPGSLASWDMDVDGDADVVIVIADDEGDSYIQLLRNDSTPGQVAYTLMPAVGKGEQPRLVTGADVSGDSVNDLVAVNVVDLPLNLRGGIDGPAKSSSLAIRRTLIGGKPNPCAADIAPQGGDGVVGVPDLLAVISNWGPCAGPPVPCIADIAPQGGDASVGVPDLLMIISNWGQCPAN